WPRVPSGWSLRAPEARERDGVVGVVEDDLDSKPHFEVAVDNGAIEHRAFVEPDERDVVGDVVREGGQIGPVEHGEAEYLTVAGRGLPVEVGSEARRAVAVWREADVCAGPA